MKSFKNKHYNFKVNSETGLEATGVYKGERLGVFSLKDEQQCSAPAGATKRRLGNANIKCSVVIDS